MKGLKGSTDEGGVRVPFFVRWDGHIAPDRDIDTAAAHIDVFPTIAALAAAAEPAGQVEGRSLLGLISDSKNAWPDRQLFTHKGRWPTGVEPTTHQWRDFAVRDRRFRLVDNLALYDMQQDPGQRENIIEQQPKIATELRSAYDRWWKETRPMMVNESAELSATRPFHELYERQKLSGGIPAWTDPLR
jgi:arylsulfatase A-like enzyme